MRQLENTEYTQESYRPNDDQRLRAGDYEAQVSGDDRGQIDDAEETAGVAGGPLDRIEAQDVLEREQKRKQPFHGAEPWTVCDAVSGDTLE